MKVIFLDHDGVICLSSEWGSRFKKQNKYRRKLSQSIESLPVDARFDNFNKKTIKTLNEILQKLMQKSLYHQIGNNGQMLKRWVNIMNHKELLKNQSRSHLI